MNYSHTQERELIEKIVEEAAALCVEYQRKGFKTEDKKTGQATDFHQAKAEGFFGDYVTEADLAVDKLLHDKLLAERPDYGWLSEESVTEDNWKSKTSFYVVDPIDGTSQFVSGGSYSVSVALVRDGKIVASAIATPSENIMVSAALGEGVFLNKQKVTLEDKAFKDQVVAVSCSEYRKNKWEPYEEDLNVRPVGSIANKLAHVAVDKEQMLVVRHPLSSWDVAAGVLMVEEQGLKVVDAQGVDFDLMKYLDTEFKGLYVGDDASLKKLIDIIN